MRAKVVKGLIAFVIVATITAVAVTFTDAKNVMGTNTNEDTVHFQTWEEFVESGVQIEYGDVVEAGE